MMDRELNLEANGYALTRPLIFSPPTASNLQGKQRKTQADASSDCRDHQISNTGMPCLFIQVQDILPVIYCRSAHLSPHAGRGTGIQIVKLLLLLVDWHATQLSAGVLAIQRHRWKQPFPSEANHTHQFPTIHAILPSLDEIILFPCQHL